MDSLALSDRVRSDNLGIGFSVGSGFKRGNGFNPGNAGIGVVRFEFGASNFSVGREVFSFAIRDSGLSEVAATSDTIGNT